MNKKAALYKQGFREITIWLRGSLNSTILILPWLRGSATSPRLSERLLQPRIQFFYFSNSFCLVRFLINVTYISFSLYSRKLDATNELISQFGLCFQSNQLLYSVKWFHSYHPIPVIKSRLHKFTTYI